MGRRAVLLRGINIGPHKRIAMPDLRRELEAAGYREVRTYLQSGNVVLSSDHGPEELAEQCRRLIQDRFGFEVPVVVRTREELIDVVAANPLGALAVEPKRYQVSFLSAALEPERVARLSALAGERERLVARGRELFAWHPDGIARSELAKALASDRLGVVATARNWSTVLNLLALAEA